MIKKNLIQLLMENCEYQKGYWGEINDSIHPRDLRGQYERSQIFWTYRNDPKAVVLFGKVFGGFSLILKTARGLHGYLITGMGGTLKFQFMEPHEVYKQTQLMKIIQKDPKLPEYVDAYMISRGVCLFNIRVVKIEKKLDKHITEGGVIDTKGEDLAALVLSNKKLDTQEAHLLIRTKTVMRAPSGNLHITTYGSKDWRPNGWFVEGEFLTTAHDLKGKSIRRTFDMSSSLILREDEYLTQQLRDTVSSDWGGNLHVILYPDNEYAGEFREACEDAAAWYTLYRIKKADKAV